MHCIMRARTVASPGDPRRSFERPTKCGTAARADSVQPVRIQGELAQRVGTASHRLGRHATSHRNGPSTEFAARPAPKSAREGARSVLSCLKAAKLMPSKIARREAKRMAQEWKPKCAPALPLIYVNTHALRSTMIARC